MLSIVKGDLKQNLLNSLKPVVALIKRNNIRTKWEKILKSHSQTQDSDIDVGDSYSENHLADVTKHGKPRHKPTQSEGSLLIGKEKGSSTTIVPKKQETKAKQVNNKKQQAKSKTEENSVSPLDQSTVSKSSINQPCLNVNQMGNMPFINYTAYYNYNNMGPQFTQNIQTPSFYQQQFFPVKPQPQIYQLIKSNTANFYQGNNGSYDNYPQTRSNTSNSGFK